ncbi:MAG: protoporphyrinogen oxidase, partial [Terriglobales bacterium]
TTPRGGMQQLVDTLVTRLDPASLRPGVAVRGLARHDASWRVETAQGIENFDTVILAIPAFAAAELLEQSSAELSTRLKQIPYSSSVTVALGYDAAQVTMGGRKLPGGFGFLVPRSEGRRMLACTFVHNKFSGRVPAGGLLLRAFFGGSTDEAALTLSDDGVLRVARQELSEILGLAAEPSFVRIYRWPRAMAQYEVGHLERVADIESLRRTLPGLHLIGNAYAGIGVPDCVRMGKEAADASLRDN